jgi:hypothetical protein
MKTVRTLSFSLLLPMLLVASLGCRHNAPNAPPASPQVVAIVTLDDAMNICNDVHHTQVNADKAIDALQATEPDYYAHAQPIIKRIRDANDLAVKAILSAERGGTDDWKGAMVALASTIKPGDLTTFGFKNKDTQTIVSTSIAGLEGILLSIPSKLGGK